MQTAASRSANAVLSLLVTVTGLTACSESPMGPADEPAPELTKVYDVDLVTRYIDVRASCDQDFLGNFDPGEFQYRIVVSGAGQNHTQASRGYNTVTGENFQRNSGTTINFANKTYIWRGLPADARIEVTLQGAEWDGVIKDSRMANRTGTETVPFKLGKETRNVTVGADGNVCQIRLVYDVTWLERVVGG